MYVRMVWGKLRPGTWEQYEEHYRQRMSSQPGTVQGLRERQLLRNSEDPDEGISLSIWDSLDDLLAYERSPLRGRLAQEVEHLYRGEYWVKHFEVVSADR